MSFDVRWDKGWWVWVEHIHDHEPDNCPAHLTACLDHPRREDEPDD